MGLTSSGPNNKKSLTLTMGYFLLNSLIEALNAHLSQVIPNTPTSYINSSERFFLLNSDIILFISFSLGRTWPSTLKDTILRFAINCFFIKMDYKILLKFNKELKFYCVLPQNFDIQTQNIIKNICS